MDNKEIENPKHAMGSLKPCIQYIPMDVILEVAKVMELGASKYGQKNWRVQPIRMSTYYNAMFRHMVDWFEGMQDNDEESKQHHLAHAICCAMIILDGRKHGMVDDRGFTEVKTGKAATPSKAVDFLAKAKELGIVHDPERIEARDREYREYLNSVAEDQ